MNTAKKNISHRSVFIATSSFFISKIINKVPARKIVFYSAVLCCLAARYTAILTEQKHPNPEKVHFIKLKIAKPPYWSGLSLESSVYDFPHQKQSDVKTTNFKQNNQKPVLFISN